MRHYDMLPNDGKHDHVAKQVGSHNHSKASSQGLHCCHSLWCYVQGEKGLAAWPLSVAVLTGAANSFDMHFKFLASSS